MARVLIPMHARRYNPNPKGSATVTVTMKGDNPFERPTLVANSRSMLPGMGGLGDDAAPAAPAPATGIDWSAVLTGAATAGTQIAQQAASNAVNKLIPPPKQPLPVANPTVALPVVNPNYQPPASKLPWILGGVGVLVIGLGAVFLLRKKR